MVRLRSVDSEIQRTTTPGRLVQDPTIRGKVGHTPDQRLWVDREGNKPRHAGGFVPRAERVDGEQVRKSWGRATVN